MLCVNFWWIWFVFDGKTERKENMVKIPVEVGEAFNAYLNLIFFDLLLVYNDIAYQIVVSILYCSL